MQDTEHPMVVLDIMDWNSETNLAMNESPKYSICMTNYNTVSTVRKSLESILAQIGNEFEVTVVDNLSDDGSKEILQEYSDRGLVKLSVCRCTRGKGRQIAFENSSGSYIVTNADFDEYYKPILRNLIESYHEHFEGDCLLLHGYAICPRSLFLKVGGYRDLQYAEDLDFFARCARTRKFKYLDLETRDWFKPYGSGTFGHRVFYKYERAKDYYRLGLKPENGLSPTRLIVASPMLILGYLSHFFYESYSDSPLKSFNKWDFVADIPGELKHQTSGNLHG
jgi:glycosyltransferase involved in cell wall biosynthesis